MHITPTNEIKSFLSRCTNNINNNYQNDFLDGYIDRKTENEAKKELLQAGQLELKDKNVSLFLSTNSFMDNAYYQNIHLNNIKSNKFAYEKTTFEKGYLFNADAIIDDPDRELKDYMKLRALDEDLPVYILYQDKKEWMMNVPSESITNDPYALKAHGKVLTFGLGIGYFVYMAMLNPNVKEITVIEKSKDVIELFKQVEKEFPKDKELNIIQGNAFDYFNEKYLKNFDYTYVDIWQSSKDGRKIITKLLENYLPKYDTCDFWIEDSCLNIIRHLILYHFDELCNQRKKTINNDYYYLMSKVKKYFSGIDKTVDDVETLKDYLYNKEIRRKILHLK